tara:strand:- start:3192 stop:3635 length:444 start_codon:yes stop_codon:yes gene_type:complete
LKVIFESAIARKKNIMKYQQVELPSNRKFGFFFSLVFFILAAYFIYTQSKTTALAMLLVASLFLVIAFFKADLLLPLNKIWMRFGLLLGRVISPIILGIIFFGLITPYSVVIRIFGRDELYLRRSNNKSHWINRSQSSPQTNFKRQF